jgi:hypothetical protein
MRGFSWFNTIFASFSNEGFRRKLEYLASQLQCQIYWSKYPPDIVAVPWFVAVVDRNVLGAEAWTLYEKYCKEIGEKEWCILIDSGPPSYFAFEQIKIKAPEDQDSLIEMIRHKYKVDFGLTEIRREIIERYSSQNIIPSPTFEDFKCPYKVSCLGSKDGNRWKSGSWPYVGFKYGEGQINGKFKKVFIVGMDRGGYRGSNEEPFEKTQFNFREATEKRWNAHMGGVSLILEFLLDEKNISEYSLQYALTNAVKCSIKSGRMNAVREYGIISNCSNHLEEEIAVLQPDIIITQGKHPQQTIRGLFPVNENEIQYFGSVQLWRHAAKIVLATPHPARLKGMKYSKGMMPDYFYDAIKQIKNLLI